MTNLENYTIDNDIEFLEMIALIEKRAAMTSKEKQLVYKKNWEQRNPAKVKAINSAAKARRRAAELNRTPIWVKNNPDEKWLIKQFYEHAIALTNLTGIQFEVDHIIPLQGNLVSGFHCWQNLQIITKTANRHKSNIFIPY